MPTIQQTINKIQTFGKLPEGWHYGEGVSANIETIKIARYFLVKATLWGLKEADAFPGIDGQIEVTLYSGNKTLSVMFEIDNTVSIVEEINNEIIWDDYEQPYKVAEQKLWELSQENQTIYDLSTLGIGTQETKSSDVPRSNALLRNTMKTEESHSFQQDVYCFRSGRSASTSNTSTVPS